MDIYASKNTNNTFPILFITLYHSLFSGFIGNDLSIKNTDKRYSSKAIKNLIDLWVKWNAWAIFALAFFNTIMLFLV